MGQAIKICKKRKHDYQMAVFAGMAEVDLALWQMTNELDIKAL